MPELSYCAGLVRRFDNDRFLCSLFAPAVEREALAALYAFNIEIARAREAAREPMLGRIRLQWWRDAIVGIHAGRNQREPVAAALADAVARFDLSCDHLQRLVDGREFDCEDRPPSTLDDLVAYAEATAAPLVALSAEICGARDDRVRSASRDLGIAWALTGLIRAVPFHAGAKRLYLPAALNRQFGLDAFDLFEQGASPGLASVVAEVSARAEQHLVQVRAARPGIPAAALPAFLPATLAGLYLKRIAAAGHDPFDRRVQATGGPARLLALLLSRLRRRY